MPSEAVAQTVQLSEFQNQGYIYTGCKHCAVISVTTFAVYKANVSPAHVSLVAKIKRVATLNRASTAVVVAHTEVVCRKTRSVGTAQTILTIVPPHINARKARLDAHKHAGRAASSAHVSKQHRTSVARARWPSEGPLAQELLGVGQGRPGGGSARWRTRLWSRWSRMG